MGKGYGDVKREGLLYRKLEEAPKRAGLLRWVLKDKQPLLKGASRYSENSTCNASMWRNGGASHVGRREGGLTTAWAVVA